MKRTALLLFGTAILMLLPVKAWSQKEAYAWLSEDGKMFIFYYDDEREERDYEGMTWDVPPLCEDPEWYGTDLSSVTTVQFDESFEDYEVEDLHRWFYGMKNLTNFNCSSLNASNVCIMNQMFEGCSSLTYLDLSNIGGRLLDDSGYRIFYGCSSLAYLDLGKITLDENMDYSDTFKGCSSLVYLKFSHVAFNPDWRNDFFEGVGTPSSPCTIVEPYAYDWGITTSGDSFKWYGGYFTKNEPYVFVNSDQTELTFYCDKLRASRTTGRTYNLNWTYSDVPGWVNVNVPTVTFDYSFSKFKPISTAYWFKNAYSLTTINHFDYLNTSNVVSMKGMFYYCQNLQNPDLSNFNTSKVKDMSEMFYNCNALGSLDLSYFDTSNVENMSEMFRAIGCSNIDLSKFDTSKVKDMSGMFQSCLLENIDLSNFYTPNVTDFTYMFRGCRKLKVVDISGLYIPAENESEGMFQMTKTVEKLYISPTMNNLDQYAFSAIGTSDNPCVIKVPSNFNFGVDTSGAWFRWKYGYFKRDVPQITISSTGYATYSFDEDLDFSGITDFKVYTATGYNKSTGSVLMQAVKDVPAGTGLIVKGTPGTYDIPYGQSSTYYTNLLVATPKAVTIQPTDGDKTNFVLAKKDGKVGFYTLSSGYEMPEYKAYLQLPTSFVFSNANCVALEFDDETDDIEGVTTETQPDAVWYTIDGRRLDGKPIQKGVYVTNGKKVMVK